jgi:hypothetical protein
MGGPGSGRKKGSGSSKTKKTNLIDEQKRADREHKKAMAGYKGGKGYRRVKGGTA